MVEYLVVSVHHRKGREQCRQLLTSSASKTCSTLAILSMHVRAAVVKHDGVFRLLRRAPQIKSPCSKNSRLQECA